MVTPVLWGVCPIEQAIASDAGNAWEAVRLVKRQLAVVTNNPSACFVLALKLATIHQTGAIDGKVPVVNGQQVPVRAVAAAGVWPDIINVCATCQIPKPQIKAAEQMLARLKLAQAGGDITSDDLARAAKGIYNGLPAIPEAADTLSKAKLIYDINKPRTGASLPAREMEGRADVRGRAMGLHGLAVGRGEMGQAGMEPVGAVTVLEIAQVDTAALDGVGLQTADLVDRRMAVASVPAPMAGSAFSRMLAKDKSLEAQERWARAVQGQFDAMGRGGK